MMMSALVDYGDSDEEELIDAQHPPTATLHHGRAPKSSADEADQQPSAEGLPSSHSPQTSSPLNRYQTRIPQSSASSLGHHPDENLDGAPHLHPLSPGPKQPESEETPQDSGPSQTSPLSENSSDLHQAAIGSSFLKSSVDDQTNPNEGQLNSTFSLSAPILEAYASGRMISQQSRLNCSADASTPFIDETEDSLSASGDLMPVEPEADATMTANVAQVLQKLRDLKDQGMTITGYIERSAEFQNPYCLEQIMQNLQIDAYCSNYPPHLYDSVRMQQYEAPRYQKLTQRFESSQRNTSNPPTGTATSAANVSSLAAAAALAASNVVAAAASGASCIIPTLPSGRKSKWDQPGK